MGDASCTRCGDTLPDGATFCIACGAPVAATGPTQRLPSEGDAALDAFGAALRAAGIVADRAQLAEWARGYEHTIISYPEVSWGIPYLVGQVKRRVRR